MGTRGNRVAQHAINSKNPTASNKTRAQTTSTATFDGQTLASPSNESDFATTTTARAGFTKSMMHFNGNFNCKACKRQLQMGTLLVLTLAAHQSSMASGFQLGAAPLQPAIRPALAMRPSGVAGRRCLRPATQALDPAALRPRTATGVQQSSMMLGFTSGVAATLTSMPMLAFKTVMLTAAAQPVLFDCLFAGILYVLGKVTSGAITGKQPSSLSKWFICGLVDGWACHAWYSLMEFKFAFIADRLQKALVMNSVSSAFFTPTYCVGFLILLSLLERNGLRGAVSRVQRDAKSLVLNSSAFWACFNMPLFLFVPLHLRVVVSMALHYVYLVGLAVWDTNSRRAAAASKLSASSDMIGIIDPHPSIEQVSATHSEESAGQDTAWGSGLESDAPRGLNLAFSKMPIVDVDSPSNNGQILPPL